MRMIDLISADCRLLMNVTLMIADTNRSDRWPIADRPNRYRIHRYGPTDSVAAAATLPIGRRCAPELKLNNQIDFSKIEIDRHTGAVAAAPSQRHDG